MKKKRILIVEDERIVAEDIKHSLIKLGYDVSGIAASCEGALKNIRETFPDLILMDIVLRGKMSGVEASKEIRARYNIPVVYLTAYTNEKVLEQAKVTEPYGYIIKPFDEKELYSTLKIALYKHELETKLKESEERYRSIFSNSPDYIYLTDVEGNLLDANPALLNRIKLSVEDFHKMNFKDFYAGDNIEEALNSIAKIRKGNEIKGLQVRAKTPKGKIFECEVNAVPLWENGKVTKILNIARDITERIKALEKLKQHQWMLEVSERELKKFSRRILSVREEEKKKLSANLHDEVGSMAVILSAHLSNIEEEIKDNNLKNALKIIDKSKRAFAKIITRLKNIAVNLRPPDLEIIGLPDALREYFFNIRKQTGITIHSRINMNNKKLSDEEAITLYRIVQESVTNIIKHAKATKITIQLSSMKGGTTLIVNDNGKGFAIRKRNQGTKSHIGIRGMTEMAESLGGTFDITSTPGQGTEIVVILPI